MEFHVVAVLFCLAVFGLARVVLSPLLHQGNHVQHALQFQVVDLAALVWLLSVALGVVHELERRHYWHPGPNNSGYGIRLTLTILLASGLWCTGVWSANCGGLKAPLPRALVSALMVPFTCIASVLVWSLFPIWALSTSRPNAATLALVYLALATSLYACRRTAARIAKRYASA